MYELKEIRKRKSSSVQLDVSMHFMDRKIYGLFGKDPSKYELAKIMALHTIQFDGEYLKNGESIKDNRDLIQKTYYQPKISSIYDAMKLKKFVNDKMLLLDSFDKLYQRRMFRKYQIHAKSKIGDLTSDQKSIVQYILSMCVHAEMILIEDYEIEDPALKKSILDDVVERNKMYQNTVIYLKDYPTEEIYDVCVVMKNGRIIFSDDRKTIDQKAYILSVPGDEDFFDTKNILKTEHFDQKKHILFYDALEAKDLEYISKKQYEITNMSLQNLVEKIEEQ